MLEMEATKERLKFANASEYRVGMKIFLSKIVEVKIEEAAGRFVFILPFGTAPRRVFAPVF